MNKFIKFIKKRSKIIIAILSSVLIFLFFAWIGVKGVIGFLAGCTCVIYLFFSKNRVLMFFVKMFRAKAYIDELTGVINEED